MMDSIQCVRGETGIIYDDRMGDHRCLWDAKFPECPERFTRVVERYRNIKMETQKWGICLHTNFVL